MTEGAGPSFDDCNTRELSGSWRGATKGFLRWPEPAIIGNVRHGAGIEQHRYVLRISGTNHQASNEQIDLSDELTVFVTTVGDEVNYRDCREHLDRQSVRYRLEVIAGVAPLSAAFQRMIESCRTPYYVQVDEDMILFPQAVETLFDEIRRSHFRTAMVCRPLWDCDIQGAIYGLKIYRHEIVRQFPYENTFSCERTQKESIEAAGFEMRFDPLGDRGSCLGEHGKHYSTRSIFLRWRRLIQKRRRYGNDLARGVPPPQFLLERYQADPTPLHLFSLLGAISGLSGELPPDGEADFREECPDYERMHAAFVKSPEAGFESFLEVAGLRSVG